MPPIGAPELVIVLFIIIVIFGAKRLPELGGALGQSIREFRKSTAELREPTTEPPMSAMRSYSPTVEYPPAQGTTAALSKACPECSSSNAGENLFCARCGARLP